jgi:radical SAM superfamily enzyme YgiQ (UPF0313 family)
MKVALVLAPGWSREKPPISLAFLSASLRQGGHQAYCFDLNNELYLGCKQNYKNKWQPENDVCWTDPYFISSFIKEHRKLIARHVEFILDTQAKIIGFSTYYPNQQMSLEMAKLLKEKDRHRIIIFGGPQCMRQVGGSSIIKEEYVDAVAVNEGEQTILDLARIVENKGCLEYCPGILFKREGSIVDCADRPPIEDINFLPFPDFSDYQLKNYLYPQQLPILSSRGCIRNCLFCTAKIPWQKYRSMSGKRIFKEIKYQLEKHNGVNFFHFYDCLVNGNIKALEELCKLVIDEKNNGSMDDLQWWGYGIIRPQMSQGLLKEMKLAGCQSITYGIESGSQKVVNLMGKKYDMKIASEVIKNTHNAGIKVTTIFMFGFPGEKEEDFNDSLRFVENNKNYIDEAIPAEAFCVIERHAPLYKQAKEAGLYLNPHPFFWETRDGENKYPQRFKRFEDFCQKVKSLNVRLIGSFDKNRRHKEEFLKEYEDYRNSIDLNICLGLIRKESCNRVKFRWEIHKECHFNCHYCDDLKKLTSSTETLYLSPEEWETIWRMVYNLYGEVEIDITGGEPAMYPGFFELAEKVNHFHILNIYTGLSKDFEKYAAKLNPKRSSLFLNLHGQYLDLNSFLDKARALKEKGFPLTVYYLAYPSQVKDIPDINSQFKQANLELKISGYWGQYKGHSYPESYTREEQDILRPYLGDMRRICYNLQGEIPKGKFCNAGYKRALILRNGDVIRCAYAPEEKLGNIQNTNFRLFDYPLACNKEFCPYNEFDNVIDDRFQKNEFN